MGVINRLARLWRTKEPRISYTAQNWQIPPGRNPQAYLKAYGQVGWLFGCVSRIASAIADTKWRLYRKDKKREEVEKHPLLDMLDYVNPFQTGQELMELSQMYLDLVGECFWILNRNGMGRPGEVWIAPPSRMHVVPSKKDFIAGFVYQYGAEKVPLETSEVIFIKYPNPDDPYRGIGPAQSIGLDLDTEIFSAQWNRNFFYNDASPGVVLTYPDELPEGEYERLREQWGERHQGYGRAHKMAILSGGATVNRTLLSQRDMDFWRLRKLSRDIILGAFGVPLSIMGISENVNRSNAESGEYVFARWVVKPRLTRLREKLNEQLVPMFDDTIELDFDDPTPENREELLEEAERGVKAGFLTINEARAMLGFDPVKTGDIFLTPAAIMASPIKAKGLDEAQKATIWRNFAERTERQEPKFRDVLRKLFNDQAREVIANLAHAGSPDEALFDTDAAIELFQLAFHPLIEGVFEGAMHGASSLIPPPAPHTEAWKQEELSDFARQWLSERSLEMAQLVNGTTKTELRAALLAGYDLGEGADELTDRVQGFYRDSFARRAALVARTEVIAASNAGALEGYRKSGIVIRKEWLAALDERTRDSHVAADGQIVGLHEDFHVGRGAGPAPGQIGLPEEDIQCRCTVLPITSTS